jgi:long-chain acyl-CoA synthetase
MPLPDVHVKIVDGDEGIRELVQGEVGEIIISAPQLMAGYWNRPADTDEMLRPRPEAAQGAARWLHTGDLGYLDEDGYLFIVDRKKDLIKPGGGFQVWPREVEETIAAHPAVAEVGVAGARHPTKGEIVKAWVVVRAGHQVSEQEVRDFCRERLAPFKVPSAVEFRAELPKTMVGKVLRRALRDS